MANDVAETNGLIETGPSVDARLDSPHEPLQTQHFSTYLFDVGFFAALALAGVSLIASVTYLFTFMNAANNAINTFVQDFERLRQHTDQSADFPLDANALEMLFEHLRQHTDQSAAHQTYSGSEHLLPPSEDTLRSVPSSNLTHGETWDRVPTGSATFPTNSELAAKRAIETAYQKIQDRVLRQLEEDIANTDAGAKSMRQIEEERMRNMDLLNFLGIAMAARLTMANVGLNSCGVFAGMSIVFLGFALFLIGIRGEMDVAASTEQYRVKIARMSPGAFAIVCASVLITVSVLNRPYFRFTGLTPGSPSTTFHDQQGVPQSVPHIPPPPPVLVEGQT